MLWRAGRERHSVIAMSPRRIAIVPHTHWDREWYSPFQTFRMDLVEMLDDLLDLMEDDPTYARFLLDGQMAVIDDYLEIRPENEGRLRALAQAGRITMGPWYILMDEFLVSGENILRNLELGLRLGQRWGGAMEVGYLPDMFGHIAQMPQILRLAGFDDAVLWRGVPSAITKNGFDWEAPDGSTVRVEYLPVGYSNGAALPKDPAALTRRTRDHAREVEAFLFDDLLLMNGSDHLRPQPFLGATVATANAGQDEFSFEITSLVDYLKTVPREGLERWKGELRSGFRSNVLMGVISNRVDVKRSAANAERAVEQRGEPLASMFLPPETYPVALFDVAWREMIRNSAHDSICACSVDDVVDAVLHRFAEARQIGDGVAAKSLAALARSLSAPGITVVNSSARPRGGVVEVIVTDEHDVPGDLQVISERGGLPGTMTVDAGTVRSVLGLLQGPKIDNDTWIQDVTFEDADDGIHLDIKLGSEEMPGVPIAEVKQDLYTALGARPDAMVHVALVQPRIRRVLAKTAPVSGFGWAPFSATTVASPAEGSDDDAIRLTNGLVDVVLDPANGTFSVDGLEGFGRLVDVGDLGDSYNYSPPATDSTVDSPDSVELELVESGPIRASAKIVATYTLPECIEAGSQRRVGSREHVIETTIEIHADDPTVRVSTSFENRSRDHRLRIHLPLPISAASSTAECAFGTVERGLEAEGRSDEFGLPTFPSRRFVQAGGLTVVHEGLNEYELVDIHDGEARGIALTLLRATGMLSRAGITYRPLPAGPLTPVEGLQMVGKVITARYALRTDDVDPYAMATDVLLPLETVTSFGGGTRDDSGSFLDLAGAEVASLRRLDGKVVVRIFNPLAQATTVNVPGRAGALIDLHGRELERFTSSLKLGPHGIATLRLDES